MYVHHLFLQQEVSNRLREYEEQVDHLSSCLQRKSEEVEQLTTQLNHVHTEMKEQLSQARREAACLEQQFQQKISGTEFTTDLKTHILATEMEY